jgi:peroxiredoxin
MNLWATWCGPCRQETPHLVELSKEFKSSGVEIIGLSTESQDPDQEKVKEFMSDYNVQYQMVWDDSGFAPALIQLVNGRGVIPQSFIIARDGRILKHFQGFSPEKTPAALRQAIQEAVNEPPRT